jgi:hypothetical protein
MDADHQDVARLIDAVEWAVAGYGAADGSSAQGSLRAAVGELRDALLPHLQQEEDEVMPLVAETLTDAEWSAIEYEHNLQHKSRAQLAREGHWLIDGADRADRDRVLGLVPPAARFVLLHGYARAYRRRRDAWWNPPPSRRVQKHGRNEVFIEADPDVLWPVVADVTRVGEWSHECVECRFVDGATRVEPGARFRGRNRQGLLRWGRVCEVVSADDHELVWRTVPTLLYPDSTVWRLRVTPAEGGSRLEQRFDVVRAPKGLDVVFGLIASAHCDRDEALTDDLRRLGALATRSRADA